MVNKIVQLFLMSLLIILGYSKDVLSQEYDKREKKQLQVVSERNGKIVIEDYSYISYNLSQTENIFWNGYNPFYQPFNTTDYYGSGDIDLDGNISISDVQLVMDMYNSLNSKKARADVNGDGIITLDDVNLLNGAVNGNALPSSWNNLTTSSQRNNWIDKFLVNDNSNKHPGGLWWQCLNFSQQIFVHATGYNSELFRTLLDGGQTNYNLPVYVVIVSSSNFGHAINAVLIGDNPLNFSDWRFFEPQNDSNVKPGDWDMPFGCDVAITVPIWIASGCQNDYSIVTFHVEQSANSLLSYDENLIINRTPLENFIPDNSQNLSNLRILNCETSKIIFDRNRDDMTRTTDIHISALNFDSIPLAKPVIKDINYSKVLAVTLSKDGNYHILFKGKQDNNPGVFYCKLNAINQIVSDITRLSNNSFCVECGKILETSNGEIHAFWFDTWFQNPGIYWRKKMNSSWTSTLQLTQDPTGYWYYPKEPNQMLYSFDVCVSSNNIINLVWKEGSEMSTPVKIKFMQYNNSWEHVTEIESSNSIRGLIILSGNNSNIHMVYWKKGNGTPVYDNFLLYKSFDGTSWSNSIEIDNSNDVSFPNAINITNDKLLAVWMKKYNEHFVPFFSIYNGANWNAPKQVSDSISLDAWYPQVTKLEDEQFVCAWLSVSQNKNSIQYSFIDTTAKEATINLSNTLLNFGDVAVGEAKKDSIQISNSGTDILNILTAISSKNTKFSVTPSSLVINPNDSAYLFITFTPQNASQQSDTIYITHNAPGSPSKIVVTGNGKVVGIEDKEQIPIKYVLAQNYPNPFNPTTTIDYSIPNSSFVTLKIFDLLGKEIATLVNEEKSIGNYEIEFNGSNLSSGVYFYKMQSGAFVATKKLILLK